MWQADQALAASLRQRFGFSLACKTTLIYPDDTGTYCCRTVASLSLESGSHADPAGALAAIDRAMAPAPATAIVTALTRLRLRTKAKRETTEDLVASLALYAEDLGRFPADVVRETLEAWPRRAGGRWWPSWAELDQVLRAKTAFRQVVRDAVAQLLEGDRGER